MFWFLNSKVVSSLCLFSDSIPVVCLGDELKMHSGDQIVLQRSFGITVSHLHTVITNLCWVFTLCQGLFCLTCSKLFNPFSILWSRNYFYPLLQMRKTEAQYAVLVAEPSVQTTPRWPGPGVHIPRHNVISPSHSNTGQWYVSVLSIYLYVIDTHTCM